MAGFSEDCRRLGLGTVDTGRKTADREEVAKDRETVRGTERARVRKDNIVEKLVVRGWKFEEEMLGVLRC